MKIDVNKIITLGNKEKYLIISHVVNNDKDYYYIAQMDDDGKNIKENYKITVANETDGKICIDEVIGETNLKAVLPLFVADITK